MNKTTGLITQTAPKVANKREYLISRVKNITPSISFGINRLVDIFVANDPVVSAFKVSEGRRISTALRNYFIEPVEQGHSIIATDKETEEIVGITINHINPPGRKINDLLPKLVHEREKELAKFWSMLTVPKALKNEPIYNIEFAIVDPAHQNAGLARAIGKKALQRGHELGVSYVLSECSNLYTAKVAESYGYTLESSIAYESVLDSKGNRVFPNVKPPQTHLYIYVLYMDKLKNKPFLE